MKRTHKFALSVALMMAALPMFAQNLNHNSRVYRDGNAWVEETTGTMTSPTSLRVSAEMGAITVQGGARKDISYTIRKRVHSGSEDSARRAFAGFHITAANRAGQLVLEGSTEHHAGKMSVDFNFQVPRDLQHVRVSTDGGALSLHNLAGAVAAESGGGSISLGDISGVVTANTGGGSIDAANTTNVLSLNTGGGSIKITGSKGRVNASTGGGSIILGGAAETANLSSGGGSVQVQQAGGDLFATTGGGSINVGDVLGKAKLQTGGGSIKLTSAGGVVIASTGGGGIELYKLMQGARAETGAGPITAEFLGMASDSTLETSVGDVIVYIGPKAKMTVKADLDMANGHQIRSDFSDLKITGDGGDYGPKNYHASGSLNGGGPVLRVRTMSGNIEFRRAR